MTCLYVATFRYFLAFLRFCFTKGFTPIWAKTTPAPMGLPGGPASVTTPPEFSARCGRLTRGVPNTCQKTRRQQRALLSRGHGADVHRRAGTATATATEGAGCRRQRLAPQQLRQPSRLGKRRELGPRGRERGEVRAARPLAHKARPCALLVGDRDEYSVDGQLDGLAVHDAPPWPPPCRPW